MYGNNTPTSQGRRGDPLSPTVFTPQNTERNENGTPDEDIESSHPRHARNTQDEEGTDIKFNEPIASTIHTYQNTKPSYISLLIVSARRKSREPDSRLEHPIREPIQRSSRKTRQIRNIPEQFPDKLTEIYPFVRNKVKRQFTPVPAHAHAHIRENATLIHSNSSLTTGIRRR